jgi:ABC-type multidrug transport system fused ATPase/permease subunit
MAEKDNVKWLERSTIGLPRYIIILYILIIAPIAILILVGFGIIGKYEVREGYELFRDILTIILAVLGLSIAILGYLIYAFILHSAKGKVEEWAADFQDKIEKVHKDFQDKIEKVHKDFQDKIEKEQKDFSLYSNSMLFLNLGTSIWMEYVDKKKPEKLEYAINVTHRAYLDTQGLDEGNKRYERLKCETMNNLGYYLAERKQDTDRKLANQCAEFILKKIPYYEESATNWKHTYDFIKKRYGD